MIAMKLEEIQKHEFLFSFATLISALIVEVSSTSMVYHFSSIIFSNIFYRILFFIVFSGYWIILIPSILFLSYLFLGSNFLEKDYEHMKGTGISLETICLAITPIASILLANFLATYFIGAYLIQSHYWIIILGPILFLIIFPIYKKFSVYVMPH